MSDYQPKRQKKSEWEKHGDPRCHGGHYRPKENLSRYLHDDGKWSRKLLAEKLGTDVSTLSKWISGTRYLTDANLVRIALALHVSAAFLLDLRKYGGEYATSSNTSFGPTLAKARLDLEKHRILYGLYWKLLELEDGQLMTIPIGPPGEECDITDTSYYDQVFPEPAYFDVDIDDYGRLFETPYFYSEAITVMERDDMNYPGDYRDPNHLLEAFVNEFIKRGWGPNALDRIASLVP